MAVWTFVGVMLATKTHWENWTEHLLHALTCSDSFTLLLCDSRCSTTSFFQRMGFYTLSTETCTKRQEGTCAWSQELLLDRYGHPLDSAGSSWCLQSSERSHHGAKNPRAPQTVGWGVESYCRRLYHAGVYRPYQAQQQLQKAGP